MYIPIIGMKFLERLVNMFDMFVRIVERIVLELRSDFMFIIGIIIKVIMQSVIMKYYVMIVMLNIMHICNIQT